MIDRIYALRKSLHNYANGGYVLIAVTVLAMVIANSPLQTLYFSWWERPVLLQIGDFNLFEHHGHAMSLMQVINDALMAIFFFSVGLEIKREVLVGELSSLRKALLPVIAAVGGIVLPITIYRLLSSDAAILQGSAIPMATDIAFSLGILSMFGKRVPIGLKIFLATLAIADDIGGILVIALFYTEQLSILWLVYSALVLGGLLLGSRLHIHSKLFYVVGGVTVWYFFLHSGIHPTIAGVLVAFCVPAHPVMDTRRFIDEICEVVRDFPQTKQIKRGETYILSPEQLNALKSVESASDKVISPLQDLEDTLHPLINYLIIPLFAFANAGISLSDITFLSLFQGISLSIWVALVAGKFIGIMLFSYLPVVFGWAKKPDIVTWPMIAGVSALGGIGFTVSLFIGNLSFPLDSATNALLLNQAKLGILVGSLLSGVIGYFILSSTLPKKPVNE